MELYDEYTDGESELALALQTCRHTKEMIQIYKCIISVLEGFQDKIIAYVTSTWAHISYRKDPSAH